MAGHDASGARSLAPPSGPPPLSDAHCLDVTRDRYQCKICRVECGSYRGWEQHVRGRKHQQYAGGGGSDKALPAVWRMEDLSLFPTRATTLCPHAFVADLSETLRANVASYLRSRCPHSLELVNVCDHVALTQPTHLRVKELVETMEVAMITGDAIHASLARDPARVTTVYDLACGHGLLGCLLAYRFPRLDVVCVDTERRPCFDTYVGAFQAAGETAAGESVPLSNVTFVEGDLSTVCPSPSSYLIGVHACNGAAGAILDMASTHHTGFAVVPCCVPDALCSVRTTRGVGGSKASMGDDVRYAVQVGAMAQACRAERVCCIDRQITNRNLVILGWCDSPDARPMDRIDTAPA